MRILANIAKNKGPLVSVCILSWNRKREVMKTIKRVRESTYKNLEIIIVDNASTDGTAEEVIQNFPEVIVLKSPKNIGIAAWNWAFANARGEFILTLDDDSHPTKEAVEQIVSELEKKPKLGIVACNIFDYKNKHSTFKYLPKDQRQPLDWPEFVGCGAAIRKNVLQKVGYFSDRLFIYGHELDFALRVIEAGYEVRLYPNIIVYHRISPTQRFSSRSVFYRTRNFLFTAWKYFPLGAALSITFAVLIENGILSLKSKNLIVYFRGVLFGLLGLPWILKERKVVSRETIKKVRKNFPFTTRNLVRRFLKTYTISA